MHISLIFSNLVVANTIVIKIIAMYKFVTHFRKILEICKHFAQDYIND